MYSCLQRILKYRKMELNKKYARTSQSQLRWYIAFCKQHPELLQGKSCPRSPKLIQNLWNEISTNLNAMVGPSRTPDAWRESLRNWRKQLRARARKVVMEKRRTGGGPNPEPELNDFEQQALETFGIAAVEGHSNSRLGFQGNDENVLPTPIEETSQLSSELHAELNDSGEVLFCEMISESPSRAALHPSATNIDSLSRAPSCSATPNPVSPRPALQSRMRNRRGDVRDKILETVQQDIKERRQEQSRLAQSIDNLGNGLTALAGAIRELIALQMQKLN